MTTVQSSYGVAGLEQGGYSVPQGLQLGSAEGKQKGSERMTLGINKLIGPHIVAAGQTTLNTSATFTKVPVPTINDAVVTASTTTVNGYLTYARSGDNEFMLYNGSMSVNTGGTLDMGTAASPIRILLRKAAAICPSDEVVETFI